MHANASFVYITYIYIFYFYFYINLQLSKDLPKCYFLSFFSPSILACNRFANLILQDSECVGRFWASWASFVGSSFNPARPRCCFVAPKHSPSWPCGATLSSSQTLSGSNSKSRRHLRHLVVNYLIGWRGGGSLSWFGALYKSTFDLEWQWLKRYLMLSHSIIMTHVKSTNYIWKENVEERKNNAANQYLANTTLSTEIIPLSVFINI